MENGRLERTVCLHQVLLKMGKKCANVFDMLKAASGEQTVE
jgi:hypothetical protein